MLRRRELMARKSKLPAGYIRVKYLESNRNKVIDTKILSHQCIMDIEFQFTSNVKEQSLFGYWTNGIAQVCFYQNRWYFGYGSTLETNCAIPGGFDYDRHTISLNTKGVFIQDGSILFSKYTEPATTTKSITVFARNVYPPHNYQLSTSASIKCYSFTIKDFGNEYRFCGIPALDQSSRPCMYDTVTKQPFYNLGSGEFGYEFEDGTYVAPV